MKSSSVSECHNAPVSVRGDGDTHYWVCETCHKACNILPPQEDNKITKAPVGASGVNTGSSKNYKSIIALAEQRGYERGKRET